MIVLGLDTATTATAVGLRLADGQTIEARDDPAEGGRPGHITHLLPLAEELLNQAGVAWGAIDRVAVGVGPGTFTGLRIGVATARGLAHSLGVELVGVSTPRALARTALGEHPQRVVLAVIDARRGEVFAGAYVDGRELVGVRAMAPAELSSLHTLSAQAAAASGEHGWIAVGDGAVRYRESLALPGILTPPDSSLLHRVSGAAICELGAHAQPVPNLAILPDYCRRPDAELTLGDAGPREDEAVPEAAGHE